MTTRSFSPTRIQAHEDAGIEQQPTATASEDDPVHLLEEWHAVGTELRAVTAAVESLQQQDEEEEETDGCRHQAGPSSPSAAATAGGALQQAVMQQRIYGLNNRLNQLKESLAKHGVNPGAVEADAQKKKTNKAMKQQYPSSSLLHPTIENITTYKKDKTKKKQKVAFDVEEVDIFESHDDSDKHKTGRLVETERDRLIRMGVLTPFDQLSGFERRVERPSHQGENVVTDTGGVNGSGNNNAAVAIVDNNNLRMMDSVSRMKHKVQSLRQNKPKSKLLPTDQLPRQQRSIRKIPEGFWRQSTGANAPAPVKKSSIRKQTLPRSAPKQSRLNRLKRMREALGDDDNLSNDDDNDGEVIDLVDDDEEEYMVQTMSDFEDLAGEFDDADEDIYRQRQVASKHRLKKKKVDDVEEKGEDDDEEENSGEDEEDDYVVFEGGLKIPTTIYDRLFDYQKTGVKWLWELHTQKAGGIIGDEMGLGKTIQISAFLAGLHYTGLFKPTLIVCPATVLRQWLRELRAWYPPFRVAILHASAGTSTATGGGRGRGGRQQSNRSIINSIATSSSGILLTTYDQMRLQKGPLMDVSWGYVVLDEGHKIRNPDAEVTLTAKQAQTVHRIIMTGSPIQNRLTELWSLFDFVFPGKLGTLPVFEAQFAIPIQIGGYANASAVQVSTAYRCAVILRDLISPYLLRRRKADVGTALPKKTEQVLFCSLTQDQRDVYRSYLASKDAQEVLAGNRAALAGIDILRKVCNHPDLLERAKWESSIEYGAPERCGKLQVLDALSQRWHENGHKALIFTQTQQMLDIIEKLYIAQGLTYHRMDGTTAIAQRASLIDSFNSNPDVFAFLLTTRVGGLGVNLTGADRCVIYDPDWNPSTDAQARERAWRIGQSKEVTVYRLITAGTIEEKIYHRQVYKQFLTDKVLRDPRQKRFFKAKDMADLFTLGDDDGYSNGNETADIFASIDTQIEAAPELEEQAGGSGVGGPGGDNGGTTGTASENDQGTTTTNGDADILKQLFEGTGVRGILDHEKIEKANDADRRIAEREANRVAQRAAEMLRQSRLACQRAPVNQPTWTGRSGVAGAPGVNSNGGGLAVVPLFGRTINPRMKKDVDLEKGVGVVVSEHQQDGSGGGGTVDLTAAINIDNSRRFGVTGLAGASHGSAPTSSQIIARFKQKQHQSANGEGGGGGGGAVMSRAEHLAQRVATFLDGNGGSAASNRVVHAFRNEIGPNDAVLFRGVLREVAQLRMRRGEKVWELRPEFVADR